MKQSGSLTFRTIAILGLTWLALALGGTTALWAQAIIVLLAGILILISPPRISLGPIPITIFVSMLGLAACAYLPAAWGIPPEWRYHLTEYLHADLGSFRTPQPWITLQSIGLLFFGLVWTYYLFAQKWQPSEKSRALRYLAAGIVLLAVVSIASYASGFRIPGWNQQENRGWFPNRNQTADVLALGGIVTYAIAFKQLQKGKRRGFLWLVGLGLISVALIISYSRAGILIFFTGISLWHLGALFRPKEGKSVALGVAAILIFLSLFLLFGGTTLERFMNVTESDNPYASDYRILIQEDAVRTALQTPLLGTGLGNFEPVFTSMRKISADQNRTLHPESDWLWMAVEMGLLAPILLIVGLRWWLVQCLPFALKSGESMRRAMMVAAVLFMAHGFVDVSGHRIGSACVGLLLAAFAMSPAKPRIHQKWVAPFFRGMAVILCLFGLWWLGSIIMAWGPPTTATLDRLQAQITAAAANGRLATVSDASNDALKIVPLDWTFYFRRASAEAFQTNGVDQAEADFKIARYLEPNLIRMAMDEGSVWLSAGEISHSLEAWQEAFRRAGPQAITSFSTAMEMTRNVPEARDGLKKLAETNIDYLIVFLNYTTPEEAKTVVDNLLARDPNLRSMNYDQQKKFFAGWFSHGDQSDLARHLLSNEDWQISGWPFLALYFAGQQDFERACFIILHRMPPPAINELHVDVGSLQEMQQRYHAHPDDLAAGLLLYQAQLQKNRIDDALETISDLEKLKTCPKYIFYVKGQLCVKKQLWQEGWDALRTYGGF